MYAEGLPFIRSIHDVKGSTLVTGMPAARRLARRAFRCKQYVCSQTSHNCRGTKESGNRKLPAHCTVVRWRSAEVEPQLKTQMLLSDRQGRRKTEEGAHFKGDLLLAILLFAFLSPHWEHLFLWLRL